MYEVSSRRCRKGPVYGRDLISVVKKLTNQPYRCVCVCVSNTFQVSDFFYSAVPISIDRLNIGYGLVLPLVMTINLIGSVVTITLCFMKFYPPWNIELEN